MSLSERPVKDLDEKYVEMIVKFISDIRNGKLHGSNNIMLATIDLLEQIINDSQNSSVLELSASVRAAGRWLARALPHELVPANAARRVLRAVRDEHRAQANQSGEGAGESLQRLVLAASARRATLPGASFDLREPLRDHLAELRTEVEGAAGSIAGFAREHVHAHELVLTFGASALAERCLRAAAPRHYRLVVVEGPSPKESHGMAARLSACGVPVTLVGSAAATALMARANKVMVGVRAVLAGGAALGAAGLRSVTAAAKHYSVPVIALAPLHKLCPTYALGEHGLGPLDSPHRALDYRSGSLAAHVVPPQPDLVPPDHISLFITNFGGSSPSYTYRLLAELYDADDHAL